MSTSSKRVTVSCILAVGVMSAVVGCARTIVRYGAASGTTAYETESFFDPSKPILDHSRLDRLSSNEELWVIAREPSRTRDNREGFSPFGITQDSLNLVDLLGGFEADSFAGIILAGNSKVLSIWDIVEPSGGLVGIPMDWKLRRERGEEVSLVPVALQHTEVHANISGYIATVDVQQQFHNPYSGKIEAVYVFPLPQNAAISEFVMTIGDRRIRGIIREKEEAERIYNEARSRGYVASLLSQQRPNIFTQKVANIEPGEQIDIDIRYFHTLAYEDGWYTFAFPIVVGPRFNPGSPAMGIRGFDDPINAISRNAPPSSSGTDIRYLKPSERSGHDIALSINIEAGVAIEEITCNSHSVETRTTSETGVSIRLAQNDSIPNKDFVLRWRIAGDRLKTALITQRDSSRYQGPPEYGHFALMIYPPQDLGSLERSPVEMIFVMDCSGSMKGEPLRIAKRAVERGLRKMDGRDTFSIIRFSDRVSMLGATPQAATGQNINRGLKYLNSLRADGGTYMVEGIKAAIGFGSDPVATGFQPVEHGRDRVADDSPRFRDRYIVFLTDGYIGNEAEVLAVLHDGVNAHGRDDRATNDPHRLETRRYREMDIRVFSFGIGSSPNRFLLERMAQVGRGTVDYVGLNDSPDAIMDSFLERASHPALTDIEIDFGPMQVSDVFPARIPDLFVGRPVTLTGRFRGDTPNEVRVRGYAGERMIEVAVMTGSAGVSPAASDNGIAQVWARQKIAQLMNQSITDNAFDFANDIRNTALEYGLVSAYTSFLAVDASEKTTGDYGTTVAVPVPVPEGVLYETTVDR